LGYAVDLFKEQSDDWRSDFSELEGTIVVELERLLFRQDWDAQREGEIIYINTGDQVNASAPGSVIERSRSRTGLKLMDRPMDWHGKIAVGHVRNSSIVSGRENIELAIIGKLSTPVARKLEQWIQVGIENLKYLYGRLPVSDVQILVFPLGYHSDPVPWREVMRGAGDAVHLYVDSTRSLEELNRNWVLTHELSHFVHPYLTGADAWLSEGIASYYQNVLNARSDSLDVESAWKKLHAGFKRGIAQVNRVDTLARDTRSMLRQRQYIRVYWSGAAIALISDVQYHDRSDGATSLDAMLAEFSTCCLPSRRRWRALELMTKLDDIAGYEVMVPLHRRFVEQPMFPDLENLYERLGLQERSRRLEFDHGAAARQGRKNIMGRKQLYASVIGGLK